MQNLAHSASFHSREKTAPSKPGIKQSHKLKAKVRLRIVRGGTLAALRRPGANGVGVVGLVGEKDVTRCKAGQQFSPRWRVVCLPRGEQKMDRATFDIDQGMYLGGQAAPGVSHATMVIAPFLIAAPYW